MTVIDLHKMAYARMPKHEVHDRLHEMCLGIGVASLRDCTPAQLNELASHVSMIPLRSFRQAPSSSDVSKRSRSGNTKGTLRPITAQQWLLVDRIAAEMGWSKEDLTNALRKWYGENWKEQIVTTRDGVEIFRRLKAIKDSKAAKGNDRRGGLDR